MNPEQQRQRHTAVRDVQGQLNDLILVVSAMDEAFVAFSKEARLRLDRHAVALQNVKDDRERRIAEWEALSLWGRLRCLLTGKTR